LDEYETWGDFMLIIWLTVWDTPLRVSCCRLGLILNVAVHHNNSLKITALILTQIDG